jgi:hypothetical protein
MQFFIELLLLGLSAGAIYGVLTQGRVRVYRLIMGAVRSGSYETKLSAERLDTIDSEEREFTYSVVDAVPDVENFKGILKHDPETSERTEVNWTASFDPRGPSPATGRAAAYRATIETLEGRLSE